LSTRITGKCRRPAGDLVGESKHSRSTSVAQLILIRHFPTGLVHPISRTVSELTVPYADENRNKRSRAVVVRDNFVRVGKKNRNTARTLTNNLRNGFVIFTFAVRTDASATRRPVRVVPVESETTTGTAYRPPAGTTIPWRYRASVYKLSSSPMETQSVHRTSYRPPSPRGYNVEVGTVKTKTPDDWRRSAVPVESRTTYTTCYGRVDESLETITPNRLRRDTDANSPKAHDYDSVICERMSSSERVD